MRPLIIAAAALAVFFLAMSMLATSALPAPAASANDHCLLCHPQPHADGWLSAHAGELSDAAVSTTSCEDCHKASECDSCHAGVGIGAGASGMPSAGQ